MNIMNQQTRQHLFLGLLLMSCYGLLAQKSPPPDPNWNITLGYQHVRMLDEAASPLLYVSNNGLLSFNYDKGFQSKSWELGVTLSVGSNQSKRFGRRFATLIDDYTFDGERDSSIYELNPSLSYVQASLYYTRYWKINSAMPIQLGARIHNSLFYSGIGADTWFVNQFSLMPAVRTKLIQRDKVQVRSELTIPVLSYLLRQPYSLDPSLPINSYLRAYVMTGSSFVTPLQFQQINLKLSCQYSLDNDNKLGLVYTGMWMHNRPFPERSLSLYSHAISLSYAF